jgi:hypothetical protein
MDEKNNQETNKELTNKSTMKLITSIISDGWKCFAWWLQSF